MGATAKTLLLMGVLTGLLAGLGYLFLGGLFGLIFFVGLAAAFNLFAYWKSDSLALRMAGAREVTPEEEPRLHRIVEEVVSLTTLPSRASTSSITRRRTPSRPAATRSTPSSRRRAAS